MKKLLTGVFLILTLLSCNSVDPTQFTEEALNDVFLNQNGQQIPFKAILEKHKGQTILIDVWASWCSDCIAGMPKVKALQQQFPDATYLFISMDKNYESWTKGISKYDVQGEHYLTSDGMKGIFGKSINLSWIPRYIVVDKTGKIALFKAIEADDEKLIATLNKLK